MISSMVATGNAYSAEARGVSPEMMVGYGTEYRWVTSYARTYGTAPTRQAMIDRFPDFPYVEADDLAYSADEVIYAHTRRELTKTIKSATTSIVEGDLEEALFTISSFCPPRPGNEIRVNSITDTTVLDDWDRPIGGVRMPWRSLQAVSGGIQPGWLWFFAGRPNQGKSWNLLEVTVEALFAGKTVTFFSLEMDRKQVETRLHVSLARRLKESLKHAEIRDRVVDLREYRRIISRIADEVPGKLFVRDASMGRCNPAAVNAHAPDSDLIVIDYVGLMFTPMGNPVIEDWRSMAVVSNMLKEISVSKSVPILAASQINREGESNSWRPPKLSQMSQSDALGQDADLVLTHKQYSQTTQVASVEKNRHGPKGNLFWTTFQPEVGSNIEITRDHADDLRAAEDEGA